MDRAATRTALQEYEFDAVSASVVLPLLKRYWFAPIHRLVPAPIHANVITLAGAACMLMCFLGCLAYRSHPSPALLIFSGLMLWTYATFDNIDGSRARMTGTSGPLGELFDHGTDSLTVYLTPLALGICLDIPQTALLAAVALGAITCHAAFWELYHTGKLVTGRISDVEGFLASSTLLVLTGLIGIQPFKTSLFATEYTAVDAIVLVTIVSFILQIISCMWRIGSLRKATQLFPVWVTSGLFILWFVIGDGAVGVLPLCMVLGLAGGRPTMHSVVHRLYKKPFPVFDWLTLGIAVVAPLTVFAGDVVAAHQPHIAWGIAATLAVLHVSRMAREARIIAELTNSTILHLPRSQQATAATS